MSQKSSTPLILGVVLALVLVGGSIFVLNLPDDSSSASSSVSSSSVAQSSVSSQQNTDSADDSMAAQYADGLYSAAGQYTVPGPLVDTVEVGLTLENDVITQVTTSVESESQTSLFWMGQFRDGIADVVVGKDIDDVTAGDVAFVNGASLTGTGFMEALDEIKQQAGQ